jgi:RNA polymerase sigma factor (sigma-70 family)
MKDETKDFEKHVTDMKPIIYSIIRKLNIYKNFEEYYQAGLIGLWDAYRAYDPEKGNFGTFAYHYIRGAILKELNKNRIKEEGEQLVDDYQWQVIANSVVENKDNIKMVELLELLKSLPKKQQQIIDLYYFKGIKLIEIAEFFGVSYQTVKLWHRNVIRELRKKVSQS